MAGSEINFGSLFSEGGTGGGVNIQSLPTLGLSALENFAGVDIPGFGDNMGSTIGSGIGAIAGSIIPGVGTALGALAGNFIGGFGGSMFGGGGHHKVPLPDFTVPSNTPSILDTPNQLRSYRGSGGEGGILTGQKRSVHQLFFPTRDKLRTYRSQVPGLDAAIDKMIAEYERHSSGIPSSPSDSVRRNQAMANVTSYAVSLLDQIENSNNEQQERRSQFLSDNPQINSFLETQIANGGDEDTLRNQLFDELENATRDELLDFEGNINRLDALQGARYRDPEITDKPFDTEQFGFNELFGGSLEELPGEREFLEDQQAFTDLLTQQQIDKARQQDENATPEEKSNSALALAGLTSAFLINSLTSKFTTDQVDRSIRSRSSSFSPSGSSGFNLGGVDSSLQRDTNVFQSPGFKFQKQDKSKRTDIPLDIIEENPSSFSRLAQIGQGGLVPNPQQDRGLLV